MARCHSKETSFVSEEAEVAKTKHCWKKKQEGNATVVAEVMQEGTVEAKVSICVKCICVRIYCCRDVVGTREKKKFPRPGEV